MGIDGAFVIHKEAGLTSHQVVQVVRRLLHGAKTGHAGTLDPDAEGVLPILCGKATRLFNYLLQTQKVYRTTIRFGIRTDTMDRSGQIVERKEDIRLSEDQFRELLNQFTGEIAQQPPMFSARHHQGKRLYQLARKGVEVSRKKKIVTLYEHQLLEFSFPYATFRTRCDRGTYIRVLCHDLGEAAGSGAHLHSLMREELGPFRIEQALTLAEFEKAANNNKLEHHLIPMREMLPFLPVIVVNDWELRRICTGNKIVISAKRYAREEQTGNPVYLRVLSENNELRAIGELDCNSEVLSSDNCAPLFIQPVCVLSPA